MENYSSVLESYIIDFPNHLSSTPATEGIIFSDKNPQLNVADKYGSGNYNVLSYNKKTLMKTTGPKWAENYFKGITSAKKEFISKGVKDFTGYLKELNDAYDYVNTTNQSFINAAEDNNSEVVNNIIAAFRTKFPTMHKAIKMSNAGLDVYEGPYVEIPQKFKNDMTKILKDYAELERKSDTNLANMMMNNIESKSSLYKAVHPIKTQLSKGKMYLWCELACYFLDFEGLLRKNVQG